MLTKTLMLSALACAAIAAPAGAATITQAGDTITYKAADGEENHGSLQAGTTPATITFYLSAGSVSAIPEACEDLGYAVECPTPAEVKYELGDRDDQYATSSDLPNGLKVTVDGGPGKDWLRGYDLNETIRGGPDADRIEGSSGDDHLDGGAGDDAISGYSGRDTVLGGEGNDTLHPDDYEDPSADVVDGGPGIDTIESDYGSRYYDAVNLPVSITLGGGADDGRPGEGDDLQNVERLILSDPGGKVVGSDAAEYVKLHQVGENGVLIGNGGDDELRAGDGADQVDGGAGADKLDGGFGDDTIVGGPGRDQISADLAGGDCGPLWCKYPYGNDVVEARDGEQDSITCGAGEDKVRADAADTVAPDCEQIERGGGGGGGGEGGGPVVPGGIPTPAPDRPRAQALRAKLRTALRGGLTVTLPGVAKGTKATGKARGRLVARGTVKTGGKVTLRFTKAAKRSLARKRTVKLTVAAGATRAVVTLTR